MYRFRRWSVSHSALLERFYKRFIGIFMRLHPLLDAIGYQRLEGPVRVFERAVKGAMFDCRMCGQCALSSTGMSCPMNCPKTLRNGPCGGVRLDGNCEVIPDMRCVWMEAWRGSQTMSDTQAIVEVQRPVNHQLRHHSSWLRVIREAMSGDIAGGGQ